MAKMVLGKVLKQMGMSKRQFAKRINCEYKNVFRYFHKDYDPKLSFLSRASKALGIKIRDLIQD